MIFSGVKIMYRNFIFDLYGTLIDINTDEHCRKTWTKYAGWLRTEGIYYDWRYLRHIFEKKCRFGMEARKASGEYRYPEDDRFHVYADICRAKRPDYTDEQVYHAGEVFRDCSVSYMRLYPNTIKVLEGVRAAGRNIFLLSNAQRMYTWQEMVRTGITEYFDDIFISSDFGCMKPDPVFWKMLIEKHNLDISECVMIGNDSFSDISGADAVGMDAAYVRTLSDDDMPHCKYVFEDGDISHILELLKEK